MYSLSIIFSSKTMSCMFSCYFISVAEIIHHFSCSLICSVEQDFISRAHDFSYSSNECNFTVLTKIYCFPQNILVQHKIINETMKIILFSVEFIIYLFLNLFLIDFESNPNIQRLFLLF